MIEPTGFLTVAGFAAAVLVLVVVRAMRGEAAVGEQSADGLQPTGTAPRHRERSRAPLPVKDVLEGLTGLVVVTLAVFGVLMLTLADLFE
jgi:hypothetical protein